MSLASQVTSMATRVATEIKAVRTELANGLATKVTGSGTTKITVSTTSPATGPDGELWINSA